MNNKNKNDNSTNEGKRVMIWCTPEQLTTIDLLKAMDPDVSVSQLVRSSLALYLWAQRVRRSS